MRGVGTKLGTVDKRRNSPGLAPDTTSAPCSISSPTEQDTLDRRCASLNLSMAAVSIVLIHIATVGTRQSDGGAEAHVWQLLMAGQAPILIVYDVK